MWWGSTNRRAVIHTPSFRINIWSTVWRYVVSGPPHGHGIGWDVDIVPWSSGTSIRSRRATRSNATRRCSRSLPGLRIASQLRLGVIARR